MKQQNLIKMIVSILILIIISNFTIWGDEINIANKSTSTITSFDDYKDLDKDKVVVDKEAYNIVLNAVRNIMEDLKYFISLILTICTIVIGIIGWRISKYFKNIDLKRKELENLLNDLRQERLLALQTKSELHDTINNINKDENIEYLMTNDKITNTTENHGEKLKENEKTEKEMSDIDEAGNKFEIEKEKHIEHLEVGMDENVEPKPTQVIQDNNSFQLKIGAYEKLEIKIYDPEMIIKIKKLAWPILRDAPEIHDPFIRLKSYIQAEKLYRILNENEPNDLGHLFGIARTLEGQDRIDEAMNYYILAYSVDQNNFPTLYNLSLLYLRKENYKMAIFNFNLAEKAGIPDNLKYYFYYSRGICYSRIGGLKEALMDFKLSINYNPEYPFTYFERGITYFNSNQFNFVIEDMNKAKSMGIDSNICDQWIKLANNKIFQQRSEFL